MPAAMTLPPASSTATDHEATRSSTASRDGPISPSNGPDKHSPRPSHQKLVFTDPVALRYLEEDPSTILLHRRLSLQGYEIYLVEQWAYSRIHPTFVITTYTGDASHTVFVGVLSVPTDETAWSPRLKLYFNAMTQYHARMKETPLGNLMVTDLSVFPSTLAVVLVPAGDIRKHRDDFIVNENLKRLGCSGRAGLKLQYPSPATEAKFHLLYRTSEKVHLYSAVVELVKQCQIALVIFDKLAAEYVDGLLCDVTETAIGDWWADIGIDIYNIEPSDGVLGPTTVAALLGTLLGARNRLHAYGAPVPKDAFDVSGMKRGIGSFQKSQKLERTRRLDRQTLDKLHRATAKYANSEGWTGAVKSTMAELSGKGGEMVMGMVGAREKAGIADIETLDIERFSHLVHGERAKWLWLGKPRKSALGDSFTNVPGSSDMVFVKDEQGGYVWTSRRRNSHDFLSAERPPQGIQRPLRPGSSYTMDDKDQNLSKMVLKGVSEKVSDARIGFGKFKDAVGLPGLRSHHKSAKEEAELSADPSFAPSGSTNAGATSLRTDTDLTVLKHRGSLADSEKHNPNEEEGPEDLISSPSSPFESKPPEITINNADPASGWESSHEVIDQSLLHSDGEVSDLEPWRSRSTERSSDQLPLPGQAALSLRKSQSYEELSSKSERAKRENYWPRQLSFSTVEDVILGWDDIADGKPDGDNLDLSLEEAILQEDLMASDARLFSSKIVELNRVTVPWVERQVDSVDSINQLLHERHEDIHSMYLERLAEYQATRAQSSDLLSKEGSYLTESVKRVELLGAKLDYELEILESRVEDVEAGLKDFENHITIVEGRTKRLVQGEEKTKNTSWFSWLGGIAGLTTQRQ
ncbi:hypothetical protein ASPZODRAFT_131369 [Penicilliopsis zonata CBS 506.65]|uniref:STB6-like N-terminal domain-containing protein n=1 Tax=Penicilliopsis zonata CBS 506.65 TaxID=1073090 RepID=A0A1L9SKV0_9EURO|nr:hypothetical protein ASPZODRAFT_131369 [Penicilliopsis zonata CBS 506.65]OJJ47795.1 hypothetical protein ASPZODRAFT_131369 [Penicilliopsis zonata CBS 506.65]